MASEVGGQRRVAEVLRHRGVPPGKRQTLSRGLLDAGQDLRRKRGLGECVRGGAEQAKNDHRTPSCPIDLHSRALPHVDERKPLSVRSKMRVRAFFAFVPFPLPATQKRLLIWVAGRGRGPAPRVFEQTLNQLKRHCCVRHGPTAYSTVAPQSAIRFSAAAISSSLMRAIKASRPSTARARPCLAARVVQNRA